jgi:hypothetical protein
VAVLEMNIESNAVAVMNPSTMPRPLRPARSTMPNARRECAPQRSSAAASRKPARNSRIISLAYGAVTSRMLSTPCSGSRITGSSDVAASGTGSVSHQRSIQMATASTSRWSGPKLAGATRRKMR